MVMANDKIQICKKENIEQFEELSKLTGQLAHEIKNPLSTIKINLKLINEELAELLSAGSNERASEKGERSLGRALRKISVIEKETDRLEQILDGFLRYLDRTELQLGNIDLNELISDMIDFYSPQASSHGITMREALSKEPLVCRIDPDMIKQVILNLFINSQQAMPGGGELIVRTFQEGEEAVVQVFDTGCGITVDNLPHIFEAYYSSRPQGSGLGLPTAKKIIQQHKGTIKVESEPTKGTVFTIRLPILK